MGETTSEPQAATLIELGEAIMLLRDLLPPPHPGLLARMTSEENEDWDPAGDASSSSLDLEMPAVEFSLGNGRPWPELASPIALDRAYGCLIGLAVGDALGSGGAPGEWTGITTAALCVAESLLTFDTVDQEDLLRRLAAWLQTGRNTIHGQVVGMGATTRAAIETFIASGEPGGNSDDPGRAGAGSLVRNAAIAIAHAQDPMKADRLAQVQSRASHQTPEAVAACRLFTAIMVDALDGAGKEAALAPRVMSLPRKLLMLSAGMYKTKATSEIRPNAYAVDALEAALWAVWQTASFKDALLAATELGGASACVAALTGQLAGALYGMSTIPIAWLDGLALRHKIESIAGELFCARAVPANPAER